MKFFKKVLETIILSRKLQAADATARYLIATNKDFKHFSHGELVQRILDEDNPTHLDGTPVQRGA